MHSLRLGWEVLNRVDGVRLKFFIFSENCSCLHLYIVQRKMEESKKKTNKKAKKNEKQNKKRLRRKKAKIPSNPIYTNPFKNFPIRAKDSAIWREGENVGELSNHIYHCLFKSSGSVLASSAKHKHGTD